MQNFMVVRISISEAQPQMVVADDIISFSNVVLVGKDTMLNENIIHKLKVYNIRSIRIKVPRDVPLAHEEKYIVVEQRDDISLSSVDKQAFKEFLATYSKRTNDARRLINEIGKGKQPDIIELYSLCADIMSKLKNDSDLFIFLNSLKEIDDYTYSHSINVSLICNLFGKWLALPSNEIEKLTVAGLLLDIGKTRINRDIWHSKDSLRTNEYEEIQKHTTYGYALLKDMKIPDVIKYSVVMHHERCDGSGYPMRLQRNQIVDYARIIAIIDIFDAMTSDRPYRKRFPPMSVLEELEQHYFGKLDESYLSIFIKNVAYSYLGSMVRLSDMREGEIVFINSFELTKPIIKVKDTIVDLSKERNLNILDVI